MFGLDEFYEIRWFLEVSLIHDFLLFVLEIQKKLLPEVIFIINITRNIKMYANALGNALISRKLIQGFYLLS